MTNSGRGGWAPLMPEELLALQGFRVEDFPQGLTRATIVHVCGNAMSVPAVGWALWALMSISDVPGLCKQVAPLPPGDFEE